MASGRPMAVLEVSDAERRELESLARRRKTAQALALRARIVLHCAEGLTNTEVATRLDVSRLTVGKWRRRFLKHRLDGLHDEPRSGAPRSITDEHVATVVTLTLESRPKNATHWSTRSMAAKAGLSQTAISRIWRAFGLQPHRESTFKISEDPQFVDKVRDSVAALEQAIRDYLDEHNKKPKPFSWTATADTILERVAPVCKRTFSSAH